MTEWHRAYIQNAYRELARGTTRNQLDTLNINATRKRVLDVGCGPGNLLVALSTDTPALLVGVDVDAIFLTGWTFSNREVNRAVFCTTCFAMCLASDPTFRRRLF